MTRVTAEPLKRVGEIELGASRSAVREAANLSYKEFKKTPLSSNTTDDFGAFHVYYDDGDRCEAVELFDDVEVEVAGNVVFPVTPEEAQRVIPSLVSDGDGLISVEESIGIYAPGGKMESILFGARGYYA